MKILINTPFITSPAGVANHYLGLKNYFSDKVIYNQYYTRFYIRKITKSKYLFKIIFPFAFFINYIKFIYKILLLEQPTVLLNPSFGKTAIKRDVQYLKIAKFFGCKTVVFLHGWDKVYLKQILDKTESFSRIWYRTDAFFVLAQEFKNYLLQLKIKVPIYLTTTKVNDQLVEDVKLKNTKKIQNILFLARVEKAKGIYITIDAFKMLNEKFSKLYLTVVGRGNALSDAKEYAENKKLQNISFTGSLYGEKLKKEFIKSDLYILPTHHGEGMPTSVLEAMAFGLPVITRPVGGLVDFFKNDKMGYLLESLDPKDYAEKIEDLINDVDKTNEIAAYNMKYAKKYFLASKVAKNLESILIEI